MMRIYEKVHWLIATILMLSLLGGCVSQAPSIGEDAQSEQAIDASNEPDESIDYIETITRPEEEAECIWQSEVTETRAPEQDAAIEATAESTKVMQHDETSVSEPQEVIQGLEEAIVSETESHETIETETAEMIPPETDKTPTIPNMLPMG